ncbi:MAG: NAD(+)/NADH kinase [Phycisphaerae bacterium]
MSKGKILIIGNMGKAGVADQIEALRPWFAEHADVLAVAPVRGELPAGAKEAALCVVFGGDGTLLSAGRMVAATGVPLLGVNMGKLGFLAEFSVEHLKRHLDEILAAGVPCTKRMMIEACITCNGDVAAGRKPSPGAGGKFCSPAVNDVCVAAGPPFRMIDLNVHQGDDHIVSFRGDGLVVATPTGSTGYNMSLGGPIMEPTVEAMAVTPMAPHSLTVRPIVVKPVPPIRVLASRTNAGTTVIIDGQVSCPLAQGDAVEVRRAPYELKLVIHPGRRYFQTLSDKLQWGRGPQG